MSSTFLGLNTAYSGLTAANAGLNTTANNISNVNTDGYSRQIVTQRATLAIRSYTTYGCIGAGVDTTAIERKRDAFYDFKYWNNNAQAGEYAELSYYMKQIEDYFTDSSIVSGFTSIFNEMYDSIEELSKNPGDATTKAQFLGYAENLTYYFNEMSSNLEKLQTDCNAEIKNIVSQINSYAEELASINQQINVIELSGSIANELRDQRDLIIDKLSELVDVETEEMPVYDTADPTRETGATRYVVKIAGGQTLVDSQKYSQLICEAKTNYESNNQSDAIGLYNIYWDDGRDFSLYSDAIGGQLRGLVEMRDGNNAENFNGTVSEIGQNANGNVTAKIDVTASYLKDLSTCTLPAQGIVQLGNQEYHYDSFSVTYNDAGEIESYTFVISSDPEKNTSQPSANRVGLQGSVGHSIAYQGIPYYQEQLNEWVRLFAEAFNKIVGNEDAVDGYGNKATQAVFVADEATDSSQRQFAASTQDLVAGTVIDCTDDSYYYLTAKNFNINNYLKDDAQLLATHTGSTEGNSKSDLVQQMIQLKSDSSMMSFRGCSSSDFLQCVLADVALNTQSADTLYESYKNISGLIDNQRLSVSGVDSDEEALNLVQYQHAYNLASQMISILSEVYDRLILETGV